MQAHAYIGALHQSGFYRLGAIRPSDGDEQEPQVTPWQCLVIIRPCNGIRSRTSSCHDGLLFAFFAGRSALTGMLRISSNLHRFLTNYSSSLGWNSSHCDNLIWLFSGCCVRCFITIIREIDLFYVYGVILCNFAWKIVSVVSGRVQHTEIITDFSFLLCV